MFEVEWTGGYPSFCCGEWIIKKDGIQIKLPKSVRTSNLGTRGEYRKWYFDENGCEDYYYHEDGLYFEEWIQVNRWVENITKDVNEQQELYTKIAEVDWRGCI